MTLSLLLALALAGPAAAQTFSPRVSLSDATADAQGIAAVDVHLTGFTATDSITAWQFEILLPDGVAFDSLGLTGTLTKRAQGSLEDNLVVENPGKQQVLYAAFASVNHLPADDSLLVRLHLRVDPGVADSLRFRRFVANRTQASVMAAGAIMGHTPAAFTGFDIRVRDAAGDSVILTIGYAESATESYDDGLDVLAPPEPPAGAFDARLRRSTDDYYRDIQPSGAKRTEWTIKSRTDALNYPITLAWNPDEIPFTGSVMLRDVVGGILVDLDMTTQTSLNLTDGTLESLLVVNEQTQKRPVRYLAGWNMVGLPLRIPHQAYQQIFSRGIANQLFGFRGAYNKHDTLAPGRGYWLRMSEEFLEEMEGEPIDSIDVDLQAGWNMIAGVSRSVSLSAISDPQSVLAEGSVFGFGGAYIAVDSLHPGFGYWIRAVSDGTIRIGGQVAAKSVSAKTAGAEAGSGAITGRSPEGFRSIRFEADRAAGSEGDSGNAGNAAREPSGDPLATLHFAPTDPTEASRIDPEAYALPPLPPAGVFDARLTSQTSLSAGDRVVIELQQADHPVVLRIGRDPSASARATGRSGVSGDRYSVIQRQGPIKIAEATVAADTPVAVDPRATRLDVALVEASQDDAEIPMAFTLEQNHPNPFNPTTQIGFSLPTRTHVRLDVYTLLGQRVASLVDAPLQAGRHQVTFDAGTLTSGVYVYRLQTADGQSASRRLVLLK